MQGLRDFADLQLKLAWLKHSTWVRTLSKNSERKEKHGHQKGPLKGLGVSTPTLRSQHLFTTAKEHQVKSNLQPRRKLTKSQKPILTIGHTKNTKIEEEEEEEEEGTKEMLDSQCQICTSATLTHKHHKARQNVYFHSATMRWTNHEPNPLIYVGARGLINSPAHTYVYFYGPWQHIAICVYIYIYIKREGRDRERERAIGIYRSGQFTSGPLKLKLDQILTEDGPYKYVTAWAPKQPLSSRKPYFYYVWRIPQWRPKPTETN